MTWESITPPPGYTWLADRLKKEYKRSIAAIKDVEEKRTAADVLEPAAPDRSHDRSELLTATIAALEAEVAVREDLIIFSLAVEHDAKRQRDGACATVMDIESAARQELGIPDATPTPVAVLQVRRDWWDARRQRDAIAQVDDVRTRLEHEHLTTVAKAQLDQLNRALVNEPARLQGIREAQEREIAFETRLVEQDHALRSVSDRRDERIAALLG
jgi:hypothetical protein